RASGLSEREARSLVRENPTQTLETLRYAYWLKLVHGGRGAPNAGAKQVTNWPAWLKKAIYHAWEFPPEYHAWARELSSGRGLPALSPAVSALSLPPVPASLPLETEPAMSTTSSPPAPTFADNVWGRILRHFSAENPAAYQSWLAGTWLMTESPDELV